MHTRISEHRGIFVYWYIEALLAGELADAVWELWNAGLISDEVAAVAWRSIGTH